MKKEDYAFDKPLMPIIMGWRNDMHDTHHIWTAKAVLSNHKNAYKRTDDLQNSSEKRLIG